MKKRRLLLFVMMIAYLVAIGSTAFAKPKRERDSEFLAKLSSYRTWTQVNRLDGDVSSLTYKIEDSAAFAGG